MTVESVRKNNKLLAQVSGAELKGLLTNAELVDLPLSYALIAPNKRIEHIYFPVSLLGSLVTVLEDGSAIESGTVGREGMTGVPILLNAEKTPMETLVQVPGEAIRIPAKDVKKVFDDGGPFNRLLNRYIHHLFVVASQSAACNRRHTIGARLARWLLMSSDGVGSNEIGITQNFLAVMLGVRRSGVTEAALKLQADGLIRYSRGSVTITDRKRLEKVACECYHMVRDEYDRLLA
jgi:CRP-like cAMP-binding protein